MTSRHTDDPVNLKVQALGGLSAGVIGTIIGYPLDLVKTRMQTSKEVAGVGAARTTSMTKIFSRILKEEGVASLYKGVAPPLLSLSILNMINFTSYNHFRLMFGAERGWDVLNGLAGMTVGPISGSISTVEHMVKTQMQLDNLNPLGRRFRGSLHCVRVLVAEHGPGVLYVAHSVNVAREMVFLGTYFYTYEGIRSTLVNSSIVGPSLAVPFSGGVAGALSWFISFPLDCIKARMQGQMIYRPMERQISSVTSIHVRLGVLNAFRQLWSTRGLKGLYSGVTPSIARAFLVSASRFSAYELAVWFLDELS